MEANVPILNEVPEDTKVLVNQGGKVRQIPADKIGGDSDFIVTISMTDEDEFASDKTASEIRAAANAGLTPIAIFEGRMRLAYAGITYLTRDRITAAFYAAGYMDESPSAGVATVEVTTENGEDRVDLEFNPIVGVGSSVPDAAGDTPTAAEFKALLDSLRNAGIIASAT